MKTNPNNLPESGWSVKSDGSDRVPNLVPREYMPKIGEYIGINERGTVQVDTEPFGQLLTLSEFERLSKPVDELPESCKNDCVFPNCDCKETWKFEQRQNLIDLMKTDQENGMYEPVKSETVESSTNSEIGSYHWFHTLVSKQMRIGEYLKSKTPSEEVLRSWGKQLQESSKELIAGYSKLSTPTPEPEK